MARPESSPDRQNGLRLRRPADEAISLDSAAAVRDPQGDTVLATDTQGNSLTLLEEYARRKNRVSPWELVFTAACCAASLAFAALFYLTTT